MTSTSTPELQPLPDEREAFEKAFSPDSANPELWLRRDRRGDYSNPAMQSAWQGWSARAAIALNSTEPAEIAALRRQNKLLREALYAAREAIGDHCVPEHCYSTGPKTGSLAVDLLRCPACRAVVLHDAALAAQGEQG